MKKFLVLILSLSLIIVSLPIGVAAANSDVKVIIDGQQQDYEQPPVVKDGHTLVPLRGIFEALGATISWDGTEKKITAVRDNVTIILKLNSTEATVITDGVSTTITLEVPAQIINKKTMVPLRFISKALGESISWDSKTKSINIVRKYKKPQATTINKNTPTNQTAGDNTNTTDSAATTGNQNDTSNQTTATDVKVINEIGNSTPNLFAGGFMAKQGKWIYFNYINYDSKLYKIMEDGTGLTKLSDDDAYKINVIGDYVYYINYSDSKIYRIKLDGMDKTLLSSDQAESLQVVNDWIYYYDVNGSEKVIYRMKTDGSDKKLILKTDFELVNFSVTKDAIYYTNEATKDFHRTAIDGSSDVVLVKAHAYYLNVVGDWIYFVNVLDQKVYKIKTDGTELTKLNDNVVLGIHVIDDWMYYLDKDTLNLYRMKLDGTNKERILQDSINFYSIVGNQIYFYTGKRMFESGLSGKDRRPSTYIAADNVVNYNENEPLTVTQQEKGNAILNGNMIYYISSADHSKIYKMSPDGTEYQKLNDDSTALMTIDGDWIYYTSGLNIYKLSKDGKQKEQIKPDSGLSIMVTSLNVKDGWMYLGTGSISKKIYKMRTDGTGLSVLSLTTLLNKTDKNIELVKNYIYFINNEDEKIYKVDINGTGYSKVNDEKVRNFIINNGYIYFTDENNTLYKINMDGTNKIKVLDNVERFTIKDNTIYYAWGWINNDPDHEGIYKINTDGMNKKLIVKAQPMQFSVAGDWIYYFDMSGPETMETTYRIQIDGTNKQSLDYVEKKPIDPNLKEINVNNSDVTYPDYNPNIDDVSEVNATSNWIYFVTSDGSLYKVTPDGLTNFKISDDKASDIHVAGDWIFYINKSDNNSIYRMKTDGTERARISEQDVYTFTIDNEYVYYTKLFMGEFGFTIYQIKTNGKDQQLLSKNYVVGKLKIDSNWIYYTNPSDQLDYRVKTDGSVEEVVTN